MCCNKPPISFGDHNFEPSCMRTVTRSFKTGGSSLFFNLVIDVASPNAK